jgi:HSP20 family protein
MIPVSKRPHAQRGSPSREKPETYFINWRVSAPTHIWRPPTDLIELEDRYLVRVEIAGVKETDFSVVLDQNLLSIQGVRADLSERRAFHQMEVNFGEFATNVEIPGPIEPQAVTAEYQHGFLWVSLPKSPPHHISIAE